jgi:hypothetical protein
MLSPMQHSASKVIVSRNTHSAIVCDEFAVLHGVRAALRIQISEYASVDRFWRADRRRFPSLPDQRDHWLYLVKPDDFFDIQGTRQIGVILYAKEASFPTSAFAVSG